MTEHTPSALAPIHTAPVMAGNTDDLIPEEAREDLDRRAEDFVAQLGTLTRGAPGWHDHLATVRAIGAEDAKAAAATSNQLLAEPVRSLAEVADPNAPVARTLADLRSTVKRLDPNRGGFARRALASLPGRNILTGWLAKYQSAQSHLDAIVERLEDSEKGLQADNQALRLEQQQLWETMARTAQWVYLVEQVGTRVNQLIGEADAAGDTDQAAALRADVLHAVTVKEQDLLVDAAVAKQNFLALQMVVSNNNDLRDAIAKAVTTTLTALRTAVIASQALAGQANVVNQVRAVRDTTSQMVVSVSEQLRDNTDAVAQERTATAVDVDALRAAFGNLYQALDTADESRSRAVETMSGTIRDLKDLLSEGQSRLAQPGSH